MFRINDSVIAAAVLGAIAVAIWMHAASELELRLAWWGFSPTYFVTFVVHPEWFQGNYPSGAEDFLRSAPMLLYLLADRIGLSPFVMMKLMLGLEILLLAGAAIRAVRLLRPEFGWAAAWLAASFLIAGSLAQPDFGRWGHPTYMWTYNFAFAGAVLGVAFAARGRLVAAAVWLSFAVGSHAILGLLGSTFAGLAAIAGLRSLRPREVIGALAAYLVLAGGWLAFVVLGSEVRSGGIPQEMYVALTRLMTSHWYPVDLGLFWERNWEVLIPFLAVSTLLANYLCDEQGQVRGINLQLALGFAGMIVLTSVGILVSRYLPQPFLIKLAFQRASEIYLIVAVCLVVPALWKDFRDGSPMISLLAAINLVTPFLVEAGVPVAAAVLLATARMTEDLRRRGFTTRVAVLAFAVFCCVLAIGIFWITDQTLAWAHFYLAYPALPVVALVAICAATWLRWLEPRLGPTVQLAMLLTLAVIGVRWTERFALFRDEATRNKAVNYLAVQRWARHATPTGALFMPEPTHYYGWRESSLRPSFGNLREWLHSGWIYNSRLATFDEGLRRFNALGIDLEPYLTKGNRLLHETGVRPNALFSKLSADVRVRYYALGSADFSRLSREFGIKYFVLDKSQRSGTLPLRVVYQNDDYAVGEAY